MNSRYKIARRAVSFLSENNLLSSHIRSRFSLPPNLPSNYSLLITPISLSIMAMARSDIASMSFHSYFDDPSIKSTASSNVSDPTVTFHHESVGSTGNKVDMIICCFSFVGCLAIIFPYVFNRRSRKLRHSLILGLATSDLVTTVIIIITTSLLLANVNLVRNDGACTFLGYILSTSIFTQHLWNLAIAIVTYMILVHPLSSYTFAVEKHLGWFAPLFWLVGFSVDAVAFSVGGFGFRGGYCTFSTNFYFSSIFQFVPRAIVFIVILLLYTRLFFFLRRTNLFKKIGTSSRGSRTKAASAQHHESIKAEPKQDLASAVPEISERSSTADHTSANSESSKQTLKNRMFPVLHKHDPAATEDTPQRRSSSFAEKDEGIELAPLTPPALNSNIAQARSNSTLTTQEPTSPLIDRRSLDETDSDADSITQAETLRTMRPRKDLADFGLLSPAVEHLKHNTAPRGGAGLMDALAMGDDDVAKMRGGPTGRRGSAVQILPGEVVVEMPTKEEFDQAVGGEDWSWGMEVGGGKGTRGNRGRHHPTASNGVNTGTSSTSSDDDGGVDSLGSTLNRQASLLLLLYPAAYCLLFSISIARLVVDMVNPAASVRNSHDALHSLSRWLIFAQGAIDAIIFQLVERQFRQRMKKRRRRAMGENVADSVSIKLGRATVEHIKKGWATVHPRHRSHGANTPEDHDARHPQSQSLPHA